MPGSEIVKVSEPEVEVDEVQFAEQDEALVEDQERVEVFPSKTDVGSAERFTIGDGVVGAALPSLPPPPPPPPPQEAIKINDRSANTCLCILCVNLTYKNIFAIDIIDWWS